MSTPTDPDLADRLRALGAGLPRRPLDPAFPDAVRARARRHRRRTLVAAAVALVAAVGVGVPAALTRDSGQEVIPASTPSPRPATPHAFGGFTVTWLPDGLTHREDLAAYVRPSGNWVFPEEPSATADVMPLLTETVGGLIGPTTFSAMFTSAADDAAYAINHDDQPARATACPADAECPTLGPRPTSVADLPTTPPGQPAAAWVSMTWQPPRGMTVDQITVTVNSHNAEATRYLQIQLTPDTVGGQPAVLLRQDYGPRAAGDDPDYQHSTPGRRHVTTLIWFRPDGSIPSVELVGPEPIDPALAHRIADGLVFDTMPEIPNYTPPARSSVPDAQTDAAVRAALTAAFTAGTADDLWAASVQNGPALLEVRRRAGERFPPMATAQRVIVASVLRPDPDTVNTFVFLTFEDPKPVPTFGKDAVPLEVTVVRGNDGRWQVSRESWCGRVAIIAADLDCRAR
ncbi:hypothetical protein I6A84_11225 [Frankia sp. CNm7]|uniref:Uncharacterized protein n=1 Tax=Frankia nepalensis TaxID=1836974 RepID=A0A937UR63_9ACTN|nr:hypothetical protein [Frankia nepalensis]MBL7498340.1 hypothetical protein [Frankia nepalensis]MBL7514988.1 hypothetical protein [Frankia nepalensis]MBL7518667.1 hypothetical protein [Frankia nepalensis]MBL7628935.1 hypothetical protein [Frankia nepalensis]